MQKRKRLILLAFSLTAAVVLALCCLQEKMPGDSLTIVCPWGVGSSEDDMLCALRPFLEERLNAEVRIINIEGAGGLNGVHDAAGMPADGRHLLFATQSMVLNDLKGRIEQPFRETFAPVARLTDAVYILSTSFETARSLFGSYLDMVNYVELNPGRIRCGTLSLSGIDGLALDKLFPEGGIIPAEYDSGKALTEALLDGDIQLELCCAGEIMGLIQRSDLIPLAVLSDSRLAMLPDVPCTAELGIDAAVSKWSAVFVPAGTDAEQTERLYHALGSISQDPDWVRYLTMSSYNERGAFLDADSFERFLENEYGRYTAFLSRRGLLKRFYGEMD